MNLQQLTKTTKYLAIVMAILFIFGLFAQSSRATNGRYLIKEPITIYNYDRGGLTYPGLWIKNPFQPGEKGYSHTLKIEGVSPDFEIIDTDGHKTLGKWELGVRDDRAYLGVRGEDNKGFLRAVEFRYNYETDTTSVFRKVNGEWIEID